MSSFTYCLRDYPGNGYWAFDIERNGYKLGAFIWKPNRGLRLYVDDKVNLSINDVEGIQSLMIRLKGEMKRQRFSHFNKDRVNNPFYLINLKTA